MSGLTRERSCCYYVPWIGTTALLILGGAMGVWIHFSLLAYNETNKGLESLGVEALNFDVPKPAVIATACVSLAFCVLLGLLSLCRGFIEAAHDATGFTGEGSTLWLWLNGFVSFVWWVVTFWTVLLIMGSTFWAGLLYVVEATIDRLLEKFVLESGQTVEPGDPCPAHCLNMMYFAFIRSDLESECICDREQLVEANSSFDDASRHSIPVLVGIWVAFLAVIVLLVNFACQYSHTKREKELIKRAHAKQFEVPDKYYTGANAQPYAAYIR